jgi:hypothetical protein
LTILGHDGGPTCDSSLTKFIETFFWERSRQRYLNLKQCIVTKKNQVIIIYTFLHILNISWVWLISEDVRSELPTQMSEKVKLQNARYMLKPETFNPPTLGFEVQWQKKTIEVNGGYILSIYFFIPLSTYYTLYLFNFHSQHYASHYVSKFRKLAKLISIFCLIVLHLSTLIPVFYRLVKWVSIL